MSGDGDEPPAYRMEEVGPECVGLVATRDIPAHSLLIAEAPLFETTARSFLNKKLMEDTHYKALQAQLREFSKSHGGLHGAEKYPDDVREVMDQIMDTACDHALQCVCIG